MTKQQIIDYVMDSPSNTNPAILGQMIDEVSGGNEDMLEVTLTFYPNKSVVSNATALLEALKTKHPSFIRFVYDDTITNENLQISVLNLWADLYTNEEYQAQEQVCYEAPGSGLGIKFAHPIGEPNSVILTMGNIEFTGSEVIPNDNDELIKLH